MGPGVLGALVETDAGDEPVLAPIGTSRPVRRALGSFAAAWTGTWVGGQIEQGQSEFGSAAVVNDHTKSAAIELPAVSLMPAAPPREAAGIGGRSRPAPHSAAASPCGRSVVADRGGTSALAASLNSNVDAGQRRGVDRLR